MIVQSLSRNLEEVTAVSSKLLSMMHALDSVLDREKDAVGRSDISSIEQITQEKVIIGEAIQDFIRKISDLVVAFGNEIEKKYSLKIEKSFNGLIDVLSGQKNFFSESNILAEKRISEFLDLVGNLRNVRALTYPKVEANIYLVNRLLQYHRETYSFWQSVAHESEAVYEANGKSRNSSNRSILAVRT